MNFEIFCLGASPLHRLDARVKLVGCFTLVVTVALCASFATALGGLALGLLLVVAARLPLATVLKRMVLVNGFVAFLWFTLPLSYPGEPLFTVGPVSFSRAGIALAALITLKTNGVVLFMVALVATSSVVEIGHGLGTLRLPQKLCLLLLFSYRYIFVINQEYRRLLRAARLRCFRFGNNLHTYRTVGYLFGMTLIKSHHRADRVRKAMVLRGFQGKFLSLHQSLIGRNELIFIGLTGAAWAGLLAIELSSR